MKLKFDISTSLVKIKKNLSYKINSLVYPCLQHLVPNSEFGKTTKNPFIKALLNIFHL